MLEKVGRRAALAEAHVARPPHGQILYPRNGHLVPLAVPAVHLFIINPLHPAITVRGDGDRAFAALPPDHARLEDAAGDAARMRELVLAVVVGEGLMLPKRGRLAPENVFPDVLVRPHLLVERDRKKRRQREVGVLEVALVELNEEGERRT